MKFSDQCLATIGKAPREVASVVKRLPRVVSRGALRFVGFAIIARLDAVYRMGAQDTR
jgi:hypothetical protein